MSAADSIATFAQIRHQILVADAQLRDPRLPSGAKKRAVRAIVAMSLEVIDLAVSELSRRQEERQELNEEILI